MAFRFYANQDFDVMSDAGINWEDIEAMSDTGINWSDLDVLSREICHHNLRGAAARAPTNGEFLLFRLH